MKVPPPPPTIPRIATQAVAARLLLAGSSALNIAFYRVSQYTQFLMLFLQFLEWFRHSSTSWASCRGSPSNVSKTFSIIKYHRVQFMFPNMLFTSHCMKAIAFCVSTWHFNSKGISMLSLKSQIFVSKPAASSC